MAEPKTKRNAGDVRDYLESVSHKTRREDALALLDIMREVTGEPAEMWGGSIVGFGSYRFTYESGREGEWMLVGFAPRKASMSLYIMPGFKRYDELLSRLGKHKIGKSCLYINKLADVDQAVLRRLIAASVEQMRRAHG